MIGRLLSQAYVGAMRLLARAPLGVVRALGRGFGWVLYALAIPRRRVVHTNLKLCFPHLDERERRDLVKRNFLCFAQSWLDRCTLAAFLAQPAGRGFVRVHRSAAVNRRRIVRIEPLARGDAQLLTEGGRTVRVSRRFRDELVAALRA